MAAWLESLGSPLAGVLAALGILLAGAGAGGLASRALPRLRHPEDRELVALLLGLDGVALIVLLAGVRGDLARSAWWIAVIAALACLGIWRVAHASRRVSTRRLMRHPLERALTVLLLLAPMGTALCFPYGWDELVYHVELPRRWLEAGGTAVLPDLPYSAFPSLLELLFTAGVKAGGVTAPRALSSAIWLLCAFGAFRLVVPALGRRAAWALAIAFVFMPSALLVQAEAYAEGLLVLHAIALALVVRDARGREHAGSIGMLVGFSGAVKLHGLLHGPAAALLMLPSAPRDGRLRRARTLVIAAGVAAVVVSPFLSRAASTGNPVAPYFARAFTPDDAAAVATSDHHHDMASSRYGHAGWHSAFRAPLELAWGDRYSGRFGWQWPLLLALGLWALRFPRGRPPMLAAALLFVAWLATAQQSRFLLPAALFVTLAASIALARTSRSVRHVLAASLLMLSLLGTPRARWMQFWSTWQAGLGVGAAPSPADFVYTGTADAHLLACDAVLRLTPPDARVLLLFDPRGLYVPRAHEVGTPLFQSARFTPPESVRGEADVLRTLREGGFTHVLVGAPPRDPDRIAAAEQRLEPLRSMILSLERDGRLERLWGRDGFLLLEIGSADP